MSPPIGGRTLRRSENPVKPVDISRDKRTLDQLAPALSRGGIAVGTFALALSIVLAFTWKSAGERFFHAYLVGFVYFLGISLGALFFVMLQHLTRAGWSVVVRRLAEGIAANTALMGILFLPILFFGMKALFPWTHAEHVAHDHVLQHKAPYLNSAFFAIRAIFYFAVWIWLSRFLLDTSRRQDHSGDAALTLSMERYSAPGMLLFALTTTFAAFDWLMSLDPHWFSTIFGVYYFSGAIISFLAALIVVIAYLQSRERLTHAINKEHFHDLGKLLFGFIVFWAYIAFSQYMLIWYGNIPEETAWLDRRQLGDSVGPWTMLGLLLLLGHFVIPFLGLLSRYPKRRKDLLLLAAVWMLVMHYIDLYWLVMPEHNSQSPAPHLIDLTTFIGLGGLYVAGVCSWLKSGSLLPEKDPRLVESLAFENA